MPGEACWPCRERKLKCNAAASGVPCARCKDTNRVADCSAPPRQKRKINRHKRVRLDDVALDDAGPAEPSIPSTLVTAEGDQDRDMLSSSAQWTTPTGSEIYHEPAARMDGTMFGLQAQIDTSTIHHSQPVPPHPTTNHSAFLIGTPLSEQDDDSILAQVCQNMTAPDGANARGAIAERTWAGAVEYQNNLNPTGILGEILGRPESSRLFMVTRGAKGESQKTRREVELHGLDEHDIAYLSAKGAFRLPAAGVWYVSH